MSDTLVYLEDHTVLFTNSSAAKTSGTVVQIGSEGLMGIIKGDVTTTGTVAAYIRGVHTVTKSTGDSVGVGERVYWHTTANKGVEAVATSYSFMGYGMETKTTSQTTVKILLVPSSVGPAPIA